MLLYLYIYNIGVFYLWIKNDYNKIEQVEAE
jgi:hypothetical protein